MIDQKLKEELSRGLDRGFTKHLKMEFAELSEGHAAIRMPMEEHLTNIYGITHGGILYTLADTTSGFAVRTSGSKVVTTNGTMNYLVSGKDTAYLRCEADVIRQGSTMAVCEAKVYDDKEKLLCCGTFTFYILKDKAEA